MLTAIDQGGNKILPIKTIDGFCPYCKEKMEPCFSQLGYEDYWRHIKDNSKNCLSYLYKNEGQWHSKIKLMWGVEFTEVYVEKAGKKMIADVMLNNGLIIEVQNSSIDAENIRLRERHYEKMVWLFNAKDAYYNDRITLADNYFCWENPRKSIVVCTAPVFLYLSDNYIIKIDHMNRNSFYKNNDTYKTLEYFGYCQVFTLEEFKNHIFFVDYSFGKRIPMQWQREFNKIKKKQSIQISLF